MCYKKSFYTVSRNLYIKEKWLVVPLPQLDKAKIINIFIKIFFLLYKFIYYNKIKARIRYANPL
jgi:hypothetical protein